MIPGPIPDELKVLNNIEEAAIKLIKPYLHIYRRKGGGVGFSGNCISFAQNIESFTKSLPWGVKDLPILVIHSENDVNKTFHANGNKIRNALKWLQKNHPEYKHIKINEDTLREYPEHGGELKGITKILHNSSKNTCNSEHKSPNDDVSLQDVIDSEDHCDMPSPEGIVFETLKNVK